MTIRSATPRPTGHTARHASVAALVAGTLAAAAATTMSASTPAAATEIPTPATVVAKMTGRNCVEYGHTLARFRHGSRHRLRITVKGRR